MNASKKSRRMNNAELYVVVRQMIEMGGKVESKVIAQQYDATQSTKYTTTVLLQTNHDEYTDYEITIHDVFDTDITVVVGSLAYSARVVRKGGKNVWRDRQLGTIKCSDILYRLVMEGEWHTTFKKKAGKNDEHMGEGDGTLEDEGAAEERRCEADYHREIAEEGTIDHDEEDRRAHQEELNVIRRPRSDY
jgi:hypothetical protein